MLIKFLSAWNYASPGYFDTNSRNEVELQHPFFLLLALVLVPQGASSGWLKCLLLWHLAVRFLAPQVL